MKFSGAKGETGCHTFISNVSKTLYKKWNRGSLYDENVSPAEGKEHSNFKH